MSCAKMAVPIEMSFGVWTWVGPRKNVLVGGSHWRHLADTVEPSMRGGDAFFCEITLTTCYGRAMEWGRPLYFCPVVSIFFFLLFFVA